MLPTCSLTYEIQYGRPVAHIHSCLTDGLSAIGIAPDMNARGPRREARLGRVRPTRQDGPTCMRMTR